MKLASSRSCSGLLARALVCAAVCVGCSSSPGPGPVDAAIILPDTGPLPEPDAGVVDGGDGTCGETISIAAWGRLPDSCLPRCTAATQAAVNACLSDADPERCAALALLADPTPAVVVRTFAGPYVVSCGGSTTEYPCGAWQGYSCQSEICPTEYDAWVTCASGGAACTAERDTLETCSHASAAWEPCIGERIGACYAAP